MFVNLLAIVSIGNLVGGKLIKIVGNSVLDAAEEQKARLIAASQGSLAGRGVTPSAQALRERIDALIDLQAQRSKKMRADTVRSAASTLDGFLAMLLTAVTNRKSAGYVHHSLSTNAFSSSKGSTVPYRLFISCLDGMKLHGLVEHVNGFNKVEDWDGERLNRGGREARFRATDKLWAMAETEGITAANVLSHYSVPLGIRELISFRERKSGFGKKGKRIFPPITEELKGLFSEMKQLNDWLRLHSYSFGPAPVLYRVFNNADDPDFLFNKGGRLYVRTLTTRDQGEEKAQGYQALGSSERGLMMINDEAVQELDIKSSQPTILYGLTGTPLPSGDIYNIAGIPRVVVKSLVTAMIGQGRTTLSSWPKGAKAQLRETLGINEHMARKRYPLRVVVDAIVAKIPPLSLLDPKVMHWAELHYIESRVILTAMQRLQVDYSILALPVHDSLIVPVSGAERAEQVLKECFYDIVGIEPRIERKH